LHTLHLMFYYLFTYRSWFIVSHMSRIQKTHYINLCWRLMKTFAVETYSAVNIMC